MKKKQVIQNEIISRTKVRNNILKLWNASEISERHDWYNEALEFANEILDKCQVPRHDRKLELNKVVGILAATSPMKRWEQNKKITQRICQTGEFSGHTKQMLSKAQRIFESSGDEGEILDILNGNKICAFYLNIRYPENDSNLTMDRHAITIALGKNHIKDDDFPALTVTQYEFFVQCYRWTAAQLGISGTLLQSATWLAHRRLKTLK